MLRDWVLPNSPDRVVWKIVCAWVITVCIWTCSKAGASWWWLASQLLTLWSHVQSRNSCSHYVCISGIFHWAFSKFRRMHAFFDTTPYVYWEFQKNYKSAVFFLYIPTPHPARNYCYSDPFFWKMIICCHVLSCLINLPQLLLMSCDHCIWWVEMGLFLFSISMRPDGNGI